MNAHFTPFTSLLGGALIGLSASSMLVLNGKIAGISGIVGGLTEPKRGEVAWRLLFVLGMLFGGALLLVLRPTALGVAAPSLARMAVAGVLVGVGTQLAGGCTSGHGVCGISRLSPRSLVATATFMLTGAIATYLVVHVLGSAS